MLSNSNNLKPISFHSLTVDDGLSQNSVVSIAQDSIGYLWFATQDGLNKYDGKSFKYYNKQFEDVTKITHSKLGKIYIDNQNTLWIIANSGKLEKYNPIRDDFNPVNNIQNASIILQDKSNNHFIGSFDGSIHVISKNDTVQILKQKDISGSIYDLLEHNDSVYATGTNAIFKISKKDFAYTKISNPFQSNINFSSLIELPNNQIWTGSYGSGLYYLENSTLKLFKGFKDYELPKNLNIETTLLDKYNRLWIGTYGNGVFIVDFNNETIENHTVQSINPFALHYNDILSFYEDSTGNIWIGTDGAGLSYYDEHLLKFNVLTNKQLPRNISVDVSRAICVNPLNNNLWIGTSGKGLTLIDLANKNYETFTKDNSNLASNRIMSIKHLNGDLWIGYQDMGLDVINSNGNVTRYHHNSKIKLNTNAVWSIYEDHNGYVWLGTGGSGLIRFDKKQGILESYTNNPYSNASLPSNNVRVITEGKPNELWIGTEDKGVCLLNTKTKSILRIENVPDKIKSLYFNKEKNVLWIGTNGSGLIKLNPNTNETKVFTTKDGLPNNVIYGILSDDDDNLWLSSNRGITMFKEEPTGVSLTNYDKYDGLQAFEFNTGAYFKDHNSTLYFGGLDGINWFTPKQLTLNQVQPKTIIKELSLFNKSIPLEPNRTFSHDENSISFKFASLHFSQPQLNAYKYMLVNHDLDWVESGNTNVANYSNLPPNTYTFKVISSNYDGIWSEDVAQYTFTIKQAWYSTSFAKIIYIGLTLFLIWSIYKYFSYRWKMQTKLKLEHAETLRLKNLDEFKSKLFTNISHEFRTPLTLILGPTERQLSKKELSKENKEELTLISQNAKRLLNLVDQLIDLAKLETGHLKLKVEHNDLSTLIHQLISAFKYQIKEKQIVLKTKVDSNVMAWYDRDIIEKIIVNLLANAVKYTPKKGFIKFNAIKQDDHIAITIINNGSKIKPEEINDLFTRFYQVNPNADGVGIGLALVKELVTLTKGTLIANAINKDELQFTITIPIAKNAFNEKDIVTNNYIENQKEPHTLKESIEDDTEQDDIATSDKPLVLVVEDNTQVRQYIKSILDNTYKVIVAKHGKKGLEKALNKIPDLIVSDIMMPEMDGIELCNTLKSNTLTSHIPVILLTAKAAESDELEGLEVGADDFITKPFNSKILVKRIENLISLSRSLQKRYTQYSILDPKDIAITNLDESFLNEVETILKQNLSEPSFSAQEFSKKMRMSRMQLHRKLMALTGLSTSQFIRSQRLKMATALLQESDLSVSEIAYQVGFNTTSYFIKCFKETYNCTPNSYINK